MTIISLSLMLPLSLPLQPQVSIVFSNTYWYYLLQEIYMNIGNSVMNIRFILIIYSLVFITGCDKFTKKETENLAPFAEQTIDLIGTLEFSLTDSEILYLRDIHNYIEMDDPYGRYIALENQAGNMLAAVITYSLQIVRISEQNISDSEKANQIADVVLELTNLIRDDEVIINKNRDDEKINKTIEKVRQQEEYLEALRLLMPLINEFSAHAGRVLNELDKEKQKVSLTIDAAIDKKYASAIELHEEIREVKDDMFRTLVNLSRYSITKDPAYLEKMKSYGMFSVLAVIKNKKSLSTAEIEQLHKAITAELHIVNENYSQLLPDIKEYQQNHKELLQLTESKEDAIREARLTFIIWARAYQKMASGKTGPAEWFDISDTGMLLFGAAKRASGI